MNQDESGLKLWFSSVIDDLCGVKWPQRPEGYSLWCKREEMRRELMFKPRVESMKGRKSKRK